MVRPRNSIMPYVRPITDLNISNTHMLCVTDSLSTDTQSFTVSFTVGAYRYHYRVSDQLIYI